MFQFLADNLATILIFALILLLCAWIVWRLIKAHKRGVCMGCPAGKTKDGSGCAHCPHHCADSQQPEQPGSNDPPET